MLNFTEKEDGKKTRFDVLFNYANMSIDSFQLMREPGKVFRQTFSVQPSALPNRLDTGNIPHGVLQSRYIKDVTDEYWQTGSFSATLKPSMLPSGSIVYACVLNYQRWQPIWWSAKTNTNKVTYTNMCKGVVYLPQYYTNHHLVPAAYPVAFGYKGMKELKPDNIHKSTVEIKEQEHYLLFQTGKKYQLYYWDNNWKLAGIKTAAEKATSLSFENVPKNALLILVPEYSKGKDRPFVMQEDGSREWF